MGKIRRGITTLALTGLMIAIPAGAALAHECFVVNRSETGHINAGNGRWFTLDVAELLVFEFRVDETLVPDILAALEAEGFPTTFAIFEGPTLAHRSPKMSDGHEGDGKGIEYTFSGGYFQTLVEVLADFGIEVPEEEE